MQIRYSKHPYEEIELEGTVEEISSLATRIKDFITGDESRLYLKASEDFDPSPYQKRLAALKIQKTTQRNLIFVEGVNLCIRGDVFCLTNFLENLPVNAEKNTHIHYDRVGREKFVSEKSLSLTLSMR